MSDKTDTGTTPAPNSGEPDNTGKTNEGTPKPQGTEGKPETTGDKNDTQSLQAQKEHWREKALSNEAKIKEYEEQKVKQEEEQLTNQKKYQELWEKEKQEKQNISEKFEESTKKSAFIAAITKHNPADIEDAWLLADRSKLLIDSEGKINGVDEVIQSLVESKPHLFPKASGDINASAGKGSPTGPTNASDTRTFKSSEVAAMPMDQYMAEREAIQKAKQEGRWVND